MYSKKGAMGREASNGKKTADFELLDLVSSSESDDDDGNEDEESEPEVESVTPSISSPPPSPPPKKKPRREEEVKEAAAIKAEAKKGPGDDGDAKTGTNANLVYICRHCPGKTFTPVEKKGHQIFHKLRRALKKKLAEPLEKQEPETGSEASDHKPKEKKQLLSSKPDKEKVVDRGGRKQYEFRVKVGVTETDEAKSQEQVDSDSDYSGSDTVKKKSPRARAAVGARGKNKQNSGGRGRGRTTVKQEKPEETAELVENLAISAKFASLYRCKKCPEDVLFTEENREKHRKQYHRGSKTYDVDEHQDDYVVAFCFKCPHLAVPLSGWEDHLRQHKMARLFIK